MILKTKNNKEYKTRFAIFPIKIDGVWVWLKKYKTTAWFWNTKNNGYIKKRIVNLK